MKEITLLFKIKGPFFYSSDCLSCLYARAGFELIHKNNLSGCLKQTEETQYTQLKSREKPLQYLKTKASCH